MEDKQTHFGFKQVPEAEKQGKVAEVFTSVTDKYDLMNDLMSFGIHRIWKRFAVKQCNIKPGHTVLDLAGGTGDLSYQFAKAVGPKGKVYLADINYSMLSKGRDKLLDQGISSNIKYVQVNAEALAFVDNSFDCICIGFGLRNVTHIDKALESMHQALKPGGRLVILEFSKANLPGLKQAYDLYSFSLLPKIGKVVANDEASYQYLAESIRMHPDQDKLKQMVLDAGFDECDYYNLAGGIVAVHCAFKY